MVASPHCPLEDRQPDILADSPISRHTARTWITRVTGGMGCSGARSGAPYGEFGMGRPGASGESVELSSVVVGWVCRTDAVTSGFCRRRRLSGRDGALSAGQTATLLAIVIGNPLPPPLLTTFVAEGARLAGLLQADRSRPRPDQSNAFGSGAIASAFAATGWRSR